MEHGAWSRSREREALHTGPPGQTTAADGAGQGVWVDGSEGDTFMAPPTLGVLGLGQSGLRGRHGRVASLLLSEQFAEARSPLLLASGCPGRQRVNKATPGCPRHAVQRTYTYGEHERPTHGQRCSRRADRQTSYPLRAWTCIRPHLLIRQRYAGLQCRQHLQIAARLRCCHWLHARLNR
jgi:hypothetical protein